MATIQVPMTVAYRFGLEVDEDMSPAAPGLSEGRTDGAATIRLRVPRAEESR